MIIVAILFSLYDKLVEGFVNGQQLFLSSILAFVAGFLSHIALHVSGAQNWAGNGLKNASSMRAI